LLYGAFEGARLSDFGTDGMEVIGGGNRGKQHNQQAAEKQKRTRMMRLCCAVRRHNMLPPDRERWQSQHQPQKIEEKLHP